MSLGQTGPQKTTGQKIQAPTTSSPSSQFDQPFLGKAEQALGEQIFRTAASPLQEAFKEQQATGEELLAQRGVQFGGLGSESRRKLHESQQRALTGLAGQIASNLGQSALERAFASSEAAKARQFASEQSLQSQQFQSGEAEKGRQFGVDRGLLEQALQGGLGSDASADIFGKFGIDPSTIRIEGQTLEEYQDAQKQLSDAQLEDALRSEGDILKEELAFQLLQSGIDPKDIPGRVSEMLSFLDKSDDSLADQKSNLANQLDGTRDAQGNRIKGDRARAIAEATIDAREAGTEPDRTKYPFVAGRAV
jgi:hypothetical protein